jgi:hypothetical protein
MYRVSLIKEYVMCTIICECPKCKHQRDSDEIYPTSGGGPYPCKKCRKEERKKHDGKVICKRCGMTREYGKACFTCQRMTHQIDVDRRRYQRDLQEMGIVDRRKKEENNV